MLDVISCVRISDTLYPGCPEVSQPVGSRVGWLPWADLSSRTQPRGDEPLRRVRCPGHRTPVITEQGWHPRSARERTLG